MKDKKPVLTNEEKILLNLKHLISYAQEFEVPPRMTQEGMAKYLDAARPNITRSLKNLLKKGYVGERLAHVMGHRRRKKVYSLTPTGMVEADRLETALKKNLGMKEGDSSVLETYFGRPGIHMVATDERGTGKTPSQGPEMEGRPFFGRAEELRRLEDWLRNDRSYFAVITGIAGIGKTTLAKKFLMSQQRDHVWYQFHETNTLEGMLYQLGLRLSLVGRDGLLNLTSNPSTMMMRDNSTCGEALLSDLWGGSLLLAFDDLHLASPRVITFFNVLVRMLDERNLENIKVIITSRKKGNFYNRRDVKVNNRVVEIDLQGLDQKSSRSLLESKGVPLDKFKQIYSVTRGHPLALELTDASQVFDPHKDALEFVREEIFQKFSEEEKTIVELMSVYRYPVPRSWLVKSGTMGGEALDALIDRSIVRYVGMGYELHGLIREFVYDRLGQKDRAVLHNEAYELYKENSQDFLDELEGIHHLIRGGNAPEGARMLSERAEEMIAEGFFEVSYILDDLDGKILDPPQMVWMDYFKGALMSSLGEKDGAKDYLNKASTGLDKLPAADRGRFELRIYDKLGLVESINGNDEAAYGYYEKVDKVYKGMKKRTLQDELVYADALNIHALLLKKKGETQEARRLYKKGLAVLKEQEDTWLSATIHYNLGRMLEDEDEVDSAIEEYKKGLTLAETSGNDHLMVNLCNALGEVFSHRKQWDEALDHFERGLSHAIMTRDVQESTKVYLEMANMYRESLSPKGFLGKFRSYFSDSNCVETENISHLYENISALYMKRRDWEGAWEFQVQAVDMFRRGEDNRMEAKAHNNLGFINKQKNDLDRAIDEYNKALELLTKTGEKKAMGITLFNIGTAYDAKGDTNKRDSYFKRAKEIFKKLGMKKELKVIADW